MADADDDPFAVGEGVPIPYDGILAVSASAAKPPSPMHRSASMAPAPSPRVDESSKLAFTVKPPTPRKPDGRMTRAEVDARLAARPHVVPLPPVVLPPAPAPPIAMDDRPRYEALNDGLWLAVDVLCNLPPPTSGLVRVAYAADPTEVWTVDAAAGLRTRSGRFALPYEVSPASAPGAATARRPLESSPDVDAASRVLLRRVASLSLTRHDDTAAAAGPSGGTPTGEAPLPGVAAVVDPPFPLLSLTDGCLHAVAAALPGASLVAFAAVCRRTRAAAGDDRLWRGVMARERRHPTTAGDGTWRRAYHRSVIISSNWAAKRHHKTELHGATEFVYAVCLLPSHGAVVSASADSSVRLHPVRFRGNAAAAGVEFLGHRGHVTAVRPLGRLGRFVSASTADEMCVWDAGTAALVETRRGVVGTGVATLDTSPSRESIVLGSLSPHHGHGVSIIDGGRLETTATLECGAEVYGVSWLGDTHVGAACGDSRLRLWDTRSTKLVDAIAVSARGAVRCVAADDDWIATGGADGYLRLWDRRSTGACFAQARHHTECINCVRFDRQAGLVITGSDDATVAVCRLPGGSTGRQDIDRLASIATRVGVLSLDFDFSALAIGCQDVVVRLYDHDVDARTFLDVGALATVGRVLEERRYRTEAVHMAASQAAQSTVGAAPGLGTTLSR